jgi:cellulose synthase/poly-beta-1,6-N-acetylglucosamine synthase-like glycosyltransferase
MAGRIARARARSVRNLSHDPNHARLAVVICTYNRAASLLSTLDSLYGGYRGNERVDVRVVVNACHDDTIASLAAFRARHETSRLDLVWVEEAVPGKSNALNTAIREYAHDALCRRRPDRRARIC